MDTHLSGYISIIQQNVPAWAKLPAESFVFTKLPGLSNEIHKVSFQDPQHLHQHVQPKNIVLRIFGDLGGLVDPANEHRIFVELGKCGVGPLCLAYGGKWRLEQFIEQGQHLAIHDITTVQVRLVAKYLAELHKQLQKIKIERCEPMIYRIINSEQAMQKYREKCSKEGLYDEAELKQIKEISSIINKEEQEFLNRKPKAYPYPISLPRLSK